MSTDKPTAQESTELSDRLTISDDSFYLVTVDGRKTIVNEEQDAIDELRGDSIDPESSDVSVVEVTVTGDDWQIKELPWRQIALQLLGDGGDF